MNRSMSFAALAGALFGIVLVVGAIAHGTNNWHSFLSLEGFLIVIGGTVANAFMSYQARYVNQAFEAMWHMVKKPKATREGLNAEIERLIRWAYLVHHKGLIGLEGEIGIKIKEPLLRYGVELVVTGYPAPKIREMMNTAVEAEFERRVTPVAVLRNMAGTAPAFGMVGTLVGMVIMLQSVEGDMQRIGSGLAIALLATLYGIVFARLFCLPAADKLLHKEEIMRFRNYMMTEGLTLLAEKQSPRYMQDKLNSFLNPESQFNLDDYLRTDPRIKTGGVSRQASA
ncbi:MAG: MotA/TolQ/ExbB proton channel family protein [Alphaproteobacteria bacterium]|nr:MotA/TolQ/ExbB proton channel family protein [Alphaproteobacteria bacterium]